MDGQRSKRAVKLPKKFQEDEGAVRRSLPCSPIRPYSGLALAARFLPCAPSLPCCTLLTLHTEGGQPSPSTEEVGESLSVYRLLKRKEVTKDLLDHEVRA